MRETCLVVDCGRPRHGHGYCGSHYKRWKRHGDPLKTTKPYYGMTFWDLVDKSSECWLWTGTKDRVGYGRTYGLRYGLGDRPVLAHRISWLLTHGSLDPNDCVLHKCDNPPCVRPDHLFLGDRAANAADKMAKGRHRHNDGSNPESLTHGERNGRARLTTDQVVEMRKRALAGEHYSTLAEDYGISASRANGIIIGNGWRHIWPYFDPANGKNRPEAIPRGKRSKS